MTKFLFSFFLLIISLVLIPSCKPIPKMERVIQVTSEGYTDVNTLRINFICKGDAEALYAKTTFINPELAEITLSFQKETDDYSEVPSKEGTYYYDVVFPPEAKSFQLKFLGKERGKWTLEAEKSGE